MARIALIARKALRSSDSMAFPVVALHEGDIIAGDGTIYVEAGGRVE